MYNNIIWMLFFDPLNEFFIKLIRTVTFTLQKLSLFLMFTSFYNVKNKRWPNHKKKKKVWFWKKKSPILHFFCQLCLNVIDCFKEAICTICFNYFYRIFDQFLIFTILDMYLQCFLINKNVTSIIHISEFFPFSCHFLLP